MPPPDGESSDGEPDFIINHLNENHYTPERSSDQDQDPDSPGPAPTPLDPLENHAAAAPSRPPAALGAEEEEQEDDVEAVDDDDDDDNVLMMELEEDVENGGGARDEEYPSGGGGAGDSGGLSPELRPQRYLSPSALKRQILNDCIEVNNQLRALITKEIRKPGRRKSPPHPPCLSSSHLNQSTAVGVCFQCNYLH